MKSCLKIALMSLFTLALLPIFSSYAANTSMQQPPSAFTKKARPAKNITRPQPVSQRIVQKQIPAKPIQPAQRKAITHARRTPMTVAPHPRRTKDVIVNTNKTARAPMNKKAYNTLSKTTALSHSPKKTTKGRRYKVRGKYYEILPSSNGYHTKGTASWYGKPFHGRHTANGEIYNMYKVSAAHKTLPLNTVVSVKNLSNGKTLNVRINDRGPFIENREIDLSYEAAKQLGIVERGLAKVEIKAIS